MGAELLGRAVALRRSLPLVVPALSGLRQPEGLCWEPAKACGARAGKITQPVIAAGDCGWFLSSQGGRTAASSPSGRHAAAQVMFSDEGLHS